MRPFRFGSRSLIIINKNIQEEKQTQEVVKNQSVQDRKIDKATQFQQSNKSCVSQLFFHLSKYSQSCIFHIRIIKLITYTNITFHHMKQTYPLSKTLLSDLKNNIDSQILQSFIKRLNADSKKDYNHSKFSTNDTVEVTTPSTVDTTLRRRGNAISKSIRPDSRSRNKLKQNVNQNSEMSVTNLIQKRQQNQQQDINQISNNNSQLNRKILMDKAVYYGNVELPYLHSSDAIASIYERPKGFEKAKEQILINPPTNVNPHFLTNVKNLYLYYTPIDTLRQLGTGWSNLKSLTIMCSDQLRDLSGLSIFPSLQYLFVPHNNIKEISDLMYHSSLRCVDLQDNKIDLIDQIQYLYTINYLEWVDISQNPITTVKEKYRIISENLGNKMQGQQFNKVFEYEISEKALDWEIYSYENMQISNSLVKEINQQILKQQIVVGSYWRQARQKGLQEQNKDGPDIEILGTFDENDQSEDIVEELRLRVSPLTDYITSNLNLDPLKKYFYNKICPQIRPDKQKQERSSRINVKQQKEAEKQSKQPKIQVERTTLRRFALTQKLSSAVSQQKQRLTSGSLKKKLSRISMSKNINLATPLNFLKLKEEGGQSNGNGQSIGMKLIGKRKLANKNTGQLTRL